MAADMIGHVGASHVVKEKAKTDVKPHEHQTQNDKQLLETFWTLAATSDDKRVESARKLVDIVSRKQENHQRNDTPPEVLCEELQYVLKRLVKGLASSRKGARQGFAMALAQLLEQIEQIPLTDVFKLMKDHLEIEGTKREEKESLFGKAFAYLSIIQSGKLQKEDGRFSAEIVRQLQNLGIQKVFLADICFRAVTDLISRSAVSVFEEDIWPILRQEMRQGWASCSPYTLALLIVCKRNFSKVVEDKFLKKHWGHADLLAAASMPHIARIIASSTATSHPNPHALCDILLSWVMERKKKILSLFWIQVVDEHLCTSTHDENVYLAFRLLEIVLPDCGTSEIRTVFSRNLLRSYISNLANRQVGLFAAANKLSGTLANLVKNMTKAKSQLAVAQSLLLSPGHFNFDEITKSRTVYSIISNFNTDAVKLYLSWLKELFVSGSADLRNNETPDIDSGRKWVAVQVLSLVRNPSLQRTSDWLSDCFQFLFLHAFFHVRSTTDDIPNCNTVLEVPVSESLRQQISQNFYNALGVVCNLSTRAFGMEESTEEDQGELWVHVIVKYAEDLLNSPDVECAVAFSEESKTTWKEMLSTVEKLQTLAKRDKVASAAKAFQLLFLHVGLQMFSETQQAVDILQDLHGCYKRAISKRKSLKKRNEEEPEWVEVVTEILLSLLSKPSHLLRSVVDGVFKMICPHMTRDALQLLLDILDPTKSVEDSHMEITESGDEDEKEMDESDEEEEEEDDDESSSEGKEHLSNGHGAHSSKKQEEDSESNSEDSDDDEDDDNEIDEFFRNDVKTALGEAAAEEDDSDDVASDFDDDTMIKLDSTLSQLFKAKMADKRKGKKEANLILLHFKLRVLDLLNIFIKRQQLNPLLLELVLPLLVVAQTASLHKDQHVLSEKAISIYHNKLCRVKKYPHNLTEHKDLLHDTIEAIMQIAKKATSVMTVSLASAGCLFLIRVLNGNVEMSGPSPIRTRQQRVEKEKADAAKRDSAQPAKLLDVKRIGKLYSDALEDFMTHRGTSLNPLLFSDLIERFPNLAWYFAEDLVKYITTSCQIYRKTQACKLLRLLMATKPQESDIEWWSRTSEELMKDGLEVLQSMLNGEQAIKPKFLLQLLNLLKQFANTCHALNKIPDFTEMESVLDELQKKVEVSRSGELTSAVKGVIKAFTNGPAEKKPQGKRNKRKRHKRNKKNKRVKPAPH